MPAETGEDQRHTQQQQQGSCLTPTPMVPPMRTVVGGLTAEKLREAFGGRTPSSPSIADSHSSSMSRLGSWRGDPEHTELTPTLSYQNQTYH